MKWLEFGISRVILGSILSGVSALWLVSAHAKEGDSALPALDELVEQLGSENFEERMLAYDQVWEYGQDAIPALREALKKKEPEVVMRASIILRNIEAGILADLSPQVAEAVERFNQGALEGKIEALRELKELGAHKQMVYLYSWEPAGENRDALAKELGEVPIRAARNAVYSGEMEEAYKLLRISPEGSNVNKARAWLAHRLGIAEQELERLKAAPNEDDHSYELALLLGLGDRAIIKKFANEHKLTWVSAMLSLEDGNSLPALSKIQEKLETDGQAVFEMAGEIYGHRVLGEFAAADKLAEDLVTRGGRMRNHEQSDAIVALAINGYMEKALRLLERTQPLEAFDYYAATEQPSEALRVLQFPLEPEQSRLRRDKLIELAIQGNGEERHHASGSLQRITQLYYDRYGLSEALRFIRPLAEAFREEGEYEAHDFVGEYFAAMPDLGVTMAIELFEKEDDFDYIVDECFSSRREIQRVREALKARHPDLSPSEYFDMLASLIGAKYEDPPEMRRQQVLLLEMAKGQEEEEKLANALLHVALLRSDVEAIVELTAYLIELEPKTAGYYRNIQIGVSERLGKHEENAKNFQLFSQRAHASAQSLARWAVALHHLGKKEESEEKLQKALDLALDQVGELSGIAYVLSESGMQDEALKILQKQLILSDPDSGIANNLMGQVIRALEGLETKEQWRIRSAYRDCWTMGNLSHGSLNSENTRWCAQIAFESLFQQGMASHQKGEPTEAVKLFEWAHGLAKSEGGLADHFFPEIKKAGYRKQHDEWFDESFGLLSEVIESYPQAHNTLNTAAWLGARSVRQLDRSMNYIDRAIELRPHQGAYLDTKAEIFFSKGNRAESVVWSKKAVQSTQNGAISATLKSRRSRMGDESGYLGAISEYSMLKKQLWRFENEELPLN